MGSKDKNGKIRSLYEPVHGSAPEIAGKNLANPIATILSLSMAFRYSLDLDNEADVLEKANVKLGENYPGPIVDLKESRERALEAFDKIFLLDTFRRYSTVRGRCCDRCDSLGIVFVDFNCYIMVSVYSCGSDLFS